MQGSLADLIAKEQNRIPELGILALNLNEQLVPFLPGLRNTVGVVVAGKESEGAYIGEGPMVGDVIYLVNGTHTNSRRADARVRAGPGPAVPCTSHRGRPGRRPGSRGTAPLPASVNEPRKQDTRIYGALAISAMFAAVSPFFMEGTEQM